MFVSFKFDIEIFIPDCYRLNVDITLIMEHLQ